MKFKIYIGRVFKIQVIVIELKYFIGSCGHPAWEPYFPASFRVRCVFMMTKLWPIWCRWGPISPFSTGSIVDGVPSGRRGDLRNEVAQLDEEVNQAVAVTRQSYKTKRPGLFTQRGTKLCLDDLPREIRFFYFYFLVYYHPQAHLILISIAIK